MALSHWFWKTEKKTNVTEALLLEKASELAKDSRLEVGGNLKFSNGWAHNFKRRHGIRQFVMHGEGGSASEEDVRKARELLKLALGDYKIEDIYNMDETGLFYRMSPNRSLASAERRGVKKDKARITVALCSNANGSDKLPPLVIGKTKSPRCFKNVRVENLGVRYHYNQKSWMRGPIFESFLERLNARVRGRNAVLLVDNASSHHVPLANTELVGGLMQARYSESLLIMFLPPNLTSAIQPMDAGVISTFKVYYRSIFLKWKVREIDQDRPDTKLNILQAIHFVRRAWRKLDLGVIARCFRKAGILSISQQGDRDTAGSKKSLDNLEKEAMDAICDAFEEFGLENPLLSSLEALTLEELIDFEDENDIEEGTSTAEII